MGKLALGLSVSEFWQMTFAEYWAIHDQVFNEQKNQGPKKMTGEDVKSLQAQWGAKFGNIRRVSSRADRRNKRLKDRASKGNVNHR